jgi:HK97 gp10 family phage protein
MPGAQIVSDTLSPKLARLAKNLSPENIAAALEQVGVEILDVAFSLVPIDTGYLQSTLYSTVEELTLEVGATAEYAAYIEYGTWKMSAQTYLRPAWDLSQGRFAEIIWDTILKGV